MVGCGKIGMDIRRSPLGRLIGTSAGLDSSPLFPCLPRAVPQQYGGDIWRVEVALQCH